MTGKAIRVKNDEHLLYSTTHVLEVDAADVRLVCGSEHKPGFYTCYLAL